VNGIGGKAGKRGEIKREGRFKKRARKVTFEVGKGGGGDFRGPEKRVYRGRAYRKRGGR